MKNLYSLSNLKKIRWGFIEENQPISLCPVMQPGWSGIIRDTGKILGMPQKNILNLHQKNKGIIFVDHDEWNRLGRYALKKVLQNPSWGLRLNRGILSSADALTTFSHHKIFQTNLKIKTTKQLLSLYKTYLEKQSAVYNYGIIPVYMDMYKPLLTNYLLHYIGQRVSKTHYPKTAKECFALLTIPDQFSKIQTEEMALLSISAKLKKSLGKKPFTPRKITLALTRMMKNHAARFRYQGYNFEGPAFPDSYFWKRLTEMTNDPVEPALRLDMLATQKKAGEKNRRTILKDLKFDQKHTNLLSLTCGFIYSKDYRKMSLVESYYEIEPLLKELAKRFSLSLSELRSCLVSELEEMATGKIKKPADLHRRMQGFVFVITNQNLPGKIFTGELFKHMTKFLVKREDLSEINFFHGQTASLGKATGRVKIITGIRDLKKMKLGDILVTQMTNPDLVPAMKLAGAIVTDLGGITSHAAIVSRELKKPCVIGTNIATRVLKDGDLVEVDANNATIKKL